ASAAGTLALCLLLGPASVGIVPGPHSEQAPPLDDALLFLGQVALSRANSTGIAVEAGVRRWHGPVAVTLEGVEVRGFRAMLEERLSRLRDWTGLPFTLTQP